MKFFFLFILIVSSVIHLKDSWKDDNKKRARTKGFLIISIIGYYISAVYPSVSYTLLIALLTSWIGDIFLISKGNKWFVIGGVSFLLSHVFFILVYSFNVDYSKVLWWVVIPIGLIYFAVTFFISKLVRTYIPKFMLIPMVLYLLFNSAMNCFALMQLMSNPCFGTVLAYIGAVLFFASDCSLYLVRYYKKKNVVFKKHFTVMLTYILSEFLITQGMILLK